MFVVTRAAAWPELAVPTATHIWPVGHETRPDALQLPCPARPEHGCRPATSYWHPRAQADQRPSARLSRHQLGGAEVAQVVEPALDPQLAG
jgi:hypothetical protein